ncbi:MAG: ABC transporter ATP-binding protein [Trueperaceae bacterium]|nr:ABC transporter ATP-binding protein [Trueperaceae bacterium]
MAGVAFRGVSKSFGAVTAVDDVSFDIHDGEIVCLLGPSGCGKTTTLRLIAGLEGPTAGSIHIGDRDVTMISPKGRDIGMVFQDYALYPHMTISDNISYPLKVRGVSKEERASRAAEVAASLQIGNLLERRPGQISGGQQQRTSVARAVVHKPQVFLFDEPLSNLDAKLRLEARGFIKHLQKRLGVTSIYVTHDQAEAMALADRIAVMDGGRIVQMAPPLEVYHRPANTFVANFLGSPPMNLLPVRLERRTGVTRFVADAFTITAEGWHERLQGRVDDGESVILGVRPEHLALGEADDPWSFPGELYATEPLGPETLITISVGDALTTLRIFGDDPPVVDGRVHARIQNTNLRLFREGGERIELG